MTIANTDRDTRADRRLDGGWWLGLGAAAIATGVYALIRLRRRGSDPLYDRTDVPESLREDVGLPPADRSRRGWWEWR